MIQLNWGLKRAYRKWHYRLKPFKRYGIDSPVIVYSMPKTGSTSISEELAERRLDVPVYHLHALSDLDELERQARETWTANEAFLNAVERARSISAEIGRTDLWRGHRWNLISLVRDPLTRAVSGAFHHAIPGRFPDLYQRMVRGELGLPELTELIIEEFLFDWSDWFDRQVRNPFGIDVYSRPFPREVGFDVFEGPRVRLLLLRLESLDSCGDAAFRRFLNIPSLRPGRRNESEGKEYKELYKRFRREAVIPEEVLDRMYESRMGRHFYTDEELDRFRRSWSREKLFKPSAAG